MKSSKKVGKGFLPEQKVNTYAWAINTPEKPQLGINSGDAVSFIGEDGTTVTRNGKEIIIKSKVNTYAWAINTPEKPQLSINSGDAVKFIGEDGTTVTRNGKEIIIKSKDLSAKKLTGTSIDLSNVYGNNYNYATPSSATTYTTINPVINGFARCFVNAASEPTVTGASKVGVVAFTPNTDMEMIVNSPDGTNVEYEFIIR